MSNYQRLISYIYAYEGGVKGKNIGFAKLETRGNQCRISVSLKRIYVGGNPIGVYLLSGENEIRIGTLFARNSAGEFRTAVNVKNVEGSGRLLEECYGLTIHDTESAWRCYTTIWEDAVAHAAEVDLAEVTAAQIRRQEEERAAREKIQSGEVLEDLSEELEKEALPAVEEVQVEEALESLSEKPEEEALPAVEEVQVEEALESLSEKPEEEALPAAEEVRVEEALESLSEKPEEEALPAVEEVQVEEALESLSEKPEEEALPAAEEVRVEEALEGFAENFEAEKEQNAGEIRETEEKSEEEIWKMLRSRYPKILAFDYEGGCEILTIQPQDIGLLPRENWVFGSNSFLLHGYYYYRYLILARLNQKNGMNRYLLGVPGNYVSNEKYMAAMFGFSEFVLSKKQPPKSSRFGYWYRDIKIR